MEQAGCVPAAVAQKGNADALGKWGTSIKNVSKALNDVLKSIGKFLAKFIEILIGFFRSAPGEYIVFIIFIILLLTGILYLAFSPNSPFRRSGGGTGTGGGGGVGGAGYIDWVKNLSIKLNIDTSWLYKLAGKDGNDIPTVPRKVLSGGRCDSQQHLEYTTSQGNNDVCLNTTLPKVIEWNIDPTVIPEWNSVPAMVKDKLLRNGKGTKIYIPWGVVEPEADPRNPFAKLMGATNTLTPLCNKAYFEDGSSAASLFSRENNTMCERAILENKQYGMQSRYNEEETAETRRAVNRGENRECTLSD
jgi:hypothetical protein